MSTLHELSRDAAPKRIITSNKGCIQPRHFLWHTDKRTQDEWLRKRHLAKPKTCTTTTVVPRRQVQCTTHNFETLCRRGETRVSDKHEKRKYSFSIVVLLYKMFPRYVSLLLHAKRAQDRSTPKAFTVSAQMSYYVLRSDFLSTYNYRTRSMSSYSHSLEELQKQIINSYFSMILPTVSNYRVHLPSGLQI